MRPLNVGKALLAGIIGGAVFLAVEMLLVGLFSGSVWAPPRMIAAIVLGDEVLPPPATFELGVFAVAVMVHFALAIIYALILCTLANNASSSAAGTIGLGFGLILYLVNFYVFAGMFPWFAEARNWISLASHLVFGFVTALTYKGLVASAGGRRHHHRVHPTHA